MTDTMTTSRITPENLLELDDWHRFELIDGQLVERNMGGQSSRTAQVINRLIDNYADNQRLGLVFTADCGYQIFTDPHKVRVPDGSFIARGRLPNDQPPPGHVRIPPDLVVEVVSPNDLAWMIDEKVADFLAAGVRVVWVVYPATRTVHVYRPGAEAKRLTAGETLSGEDVLPGFACAVAQLFGWESQ